MTIQGLGRVALACSAIALASVGCKTEPADDGGAAGVAPLPVGGMAAPGGVGGGGMGAAGTAANTGAGAGGTGAAGMAIGAGTGGAGGMTAAGTGGMAAGGTGGMTAAGAGGMTAAGTGGMPAASEVQTCIENAAAMGRTGACAECGCMNCLAEINNCQDDACRNIVNCGQDAGCKGRECYCGTAELIICAFGMPNGACYEVIETSSGLVANGTCATRMCASDLSMLGTTDPGNPVNRANGLSICTRGQDAADGVPAGCTGDACVTPPVAEVMGKCEAECMQ